MVHQIPKEQEEITSHSRPYPINYPINYHKFNRDVQRYNKHELLYKKQMPCNSTLVNRNFSNINCRLLNPTISG